MPFLKILRAAHTRRSRLADQAVLDRPDKETSCSGRGQPKAVSPPPNPRYI